MTSFVAKLMCSSRKKSIPSPQRVNGNSKGEEVGKAECLLGVVDVAYLVVPWQCYKQNGNVTKAAEWLRKAVSLPVSSEDVSTYLYFLCFIILTGKLGWHIGKSVRLTPMCPGFDSRTRRRKWAEFVGSVLCFERFFSGYSGFPLFPKAKIRFEDLEL